MSKTTLVASFCVLSAALCACSSNQAAKNGSAPAAHQTAQRAADTPLPAETSPPGDIPDTQAFVKYVSPDTHVTIIYPEGWTRKLQAGGATFIHDFNGERIRKGSGTADSSAVRDLKSSVVKLPGGAATLLVYSSNSLPNAVTGKRIRLSNNTYIFKTPSGTVALDLWAPLGSDNVDQWKHIASTLKAR